MTGETISSVHNPRVKATARLRERREREATGRFLIDGGREITRAIDAGIKVVEAFLGGDGDEPLVREAVAAVERTGAAIHRVAPHVFGKLAFGQRETGLVVVAQAKPRMLAELMLPDRPLVVVVEGVEKPGNLGAVLRTADAAGAHAVIASGSGADFYNPNCIRASLGTVFSLPACAATAGEARRWLRERGVALFTARVDATQSYDEVDLTQPCALVLGSEARGLTDAWRGDDVTPILIPMHGAADSLNVSVAAAVLLFEAQRQRRLKAAAT